MAEQPRVEPGTGATPKADSTLAGRALWLSFAAATTGTFMVNVDASVVNVALPVMQHEFGLPIGALQWVITAYLLVITGLLPITGHLADIWGRKRVFSSGITIFVVGSLACALAPGFAGLVAARVLQGIGGAIIMANVMAIIGLIFPVEMRGRALGLIGSVVAGGTLAGPPLGGLLTAWFGWRSVFWINLPFGLWGLWGTWRYLPRFRPVPGMRLGSLDWLGAGLFAAGTTALQFGLADLHRLYGWVLLGLTAGVTWIFLAVEHKSSHPLIPLRLFRVRAFSSNLLSGMAYWMLMMFPAFLMPFYLQTELRLPVSVIGLSLVPQALAMILISPWGGRWTDRAGVLVPGRVGLGLFFVADLWLATIPAHPPLWEVWAILALIGAAAGLYSSPNNAAVLSAVSKPEMGVASSLMATQRNLGRAVGVAVASILLSVAWLAMGLGSNPSHSAPQYPQWFLAGFHVVFGVGLLVVAAAWLTLVAPSTNSSSERTSQGMAGLRKKL